MKKFICYTIGIIGLFLIALSSGEGNTFLSTLTLFAVGIILLLIFMTWILSLDKIYFILHLENDNGHRKTIKAYNLISKWIATLVYYRQGYTVYKEYVYKKN